MSSHFNVTIQIDTKAPKADGQLEQSTQSHCESAVVGPGCEYPDIASFVNKHRPAEGSVSILLALPVAAPASTTQADQAIVLVTYDAEFWKKHANPHYNLQAAYEYAVSLPVTGFHGGGYFGFEQFFTDKNSAAAKSSRTLEVENQGNGVFAFYSSEDDLRPSLYMDATDANKEHKNEELVFVLKRVLDDIVKEGWAWGN